MTTKHRARLARENAGLSVGQACKLLGIERDALVTIEDADAAFEDAGADLRDLMAEIYGVNREWLAGECPRRDYAAIDKMKNADRLSFHDRDTLAEFAAALGRRR